MFRRKKANLPEGWVLSDGETHEYIIYECGCSFHKAVNTETKQARKKWKHCNGHNLELEVAKKRLDEIWNSIMDGKVRKKHRDNKKKSENNVFDLPSIAESKS